MTVKVSPTQRIALADAVFVAYVGGWTGSMRQTSKTPQVRLGSYRRQRRALAVTGPTWDSLLTKNLIDVDGFLGKEAVEVGVQEYKDRHDGKHPGDVAREQAEAKVIKRQEEEAKVKRAKHLLRGLKLSTKRNNKILLADHITKNGLDMNSLWLDDLVSIGEGIEKLRE